MKKLLVIALMLIAIPCYADRAFMVLPMQGGSPVIDQQVTPVNGWVLLEQYKTTGLYQVTGTDAQLTALSTAKNVQLITKVSDTTPAEVKPVGDIKPSPDVTPVEEVILPKGEVTAEPVATVKAWAELDAKPVKATVDKISAIATTEIATKPVINETMTYREVITKMVTNKNWEKDYWVADK